MPQAAVFVSAIVLVVTFGWAGLAKVVRLSDWRRALGGYGFGRRLNPLLLFAVPAAEAVVVALVVVGPIKAGAALGVALLGAFCLAILRARSLRGSSAGTGERLPCGCFGRTEERDWRLMMLRNGLLVVPGAVILLGGERDGLVGAASVAPGDLLPVVLVLAALALIAWMATEVVSAKGGRS